SLLPFSGPLSILPSFPTRRSSDLYYPATRVIFALNRLQPIALYYGNDEAAAPRYDAKLIAAQLLRSERTAVALGPQETLKSERVDRKSTRLNSSHDQISYAVFCLK